MSTWDGNNFYYSGQGVAMIAERSSTGKPKGFLPIGNVSSLKVAIATTNLEHKEAQSGQRSTDLRLVTETKASLSMVMERYDSKNLSIALRGDRTIREAGTVTGESLDSYNGKVMSLRYGSVSSVTVKRGSQALTAYVDDSTAYDYKLNPATGSIQLNDGSVALIDKLTTGGTAPSAVTVGADTSVTVAIPAQAVADFAAGLDVYVAFTGFSGADAALLNGKMHLITGMTSNTALTVATDTSGKTITLGTPLSFFDSTALTANYSYAAQYEVNALTQGSKERYLRFEGLNTADGNNPVVVEVFRFSTDPLKELEFIGDTVAQFTLEGSVLADPLQSTGSKFFREILLR